MNNSSPELVFDLARRQLRDTRARAISKSDGDFLASFAADTIAERLNAVNRSFENCADILSRFDAMQTTIEASFPDCRVKRIGGYSPTRHVRLWNPDHEALALEPTSQDLITSVLGLHRTNDLSKILLQILFALKPDGLFMAAVPGSRTLQELRQSLMEAEAELTGGASMRVDPFGSLQQYGELLQQCGFALPVIDHEVIHVRYSSIYSLVADLRAMGSTLINTGPNRHLSRSVLERAATIYGKKFSDPDGRLRATFECVFLCGWAPHESQQKPLSPGSAKARLADSLPTKKL